MTVYKLRLALFVLALSVLLCSCTEQKVTSASTGNASTLSANEATSAKAASSPFNKTIGAPIDKATARRWMANFIKANPRAATEHFIDAAVLRRIVSNSACVGISLHYAHDPQGQLHIIPMGTDSNGSVIANLGFDIGTTTLDWETQRQWIANYTGTVKSHFFGTQTFTRLLESRVQIVRISMALDDAANPQLLLSDASSGDPPSFEDKSIPCPPFCSI